MLGILAVRWGGASALPVPPPRLRLCDSKICAILRIQHSANSTKFITFYYNNTIILLLNGISLIPVGYRRHNMLILVMLKGLSLKYKFIRFCGFFLLVVRKILRIGHDAALTQGAALRIALRPSVRLSVSVQFC